METVNTLCAYLFFAAGICAIIGAIWPSLFLPKNKEFKHPRLSVFCAFLGLMLVFALIGGATLSESPVGGTETQKSGVSTNKLNQNKEPEEIVISDSLLTAILKHDFDSLYNRLMDLDKPSPFPKNRKSVHQEIQSYLYDGWWGIMEKADSSRTLLPLCRKEYEKACKKYDKEYARFLTYGEEDEDMVKYWAESEAKRILKQVLRDPKSLDIIGVTSCSKVSKGYRCRVQYRAKNGFGGYAVEQIDMVLAYDDDNSWYRCVEVK